MHPLKSLGHIPNILKYDYRAFYGLLVFFLITTYPSHAQLAIELQVQPITCVGINDASIVAAVNGGLPPYQYLWNTGDSTAVIGNLSAGDYSLTVSDNAGAQVEASAVINSVASLLLFLTPTETSCLTSANGELLVEAFGGNPPYHYGWSNGKEGPHLDDLKVGDYRVTVTDANGCQQESSIHLGAQSQLNVGALGTPASCLGVKDGFATASAQYGQQPYHYHWENGGETQVLPDLDVGAYGVTVTDALGCVDTAIAWVQSSFDIEVNETALLCGPGPNSSMTIVPVGGTAPYEYHWNTGAESPVMGNLSEGDYTVTVNDANGCKMSKTLSVEPFDFSISVIPRDVLCHGDSTGSIIVQVSGGEMPYSYIWNNGDTTDVLTDIPVGMYAVTVSDVNGCELSESLELTAPPPLVLTTEVTEIACDDEESGKIKINPSGGKAPYSFLWSNNQIWDEIDNLSAGIYTVTVSDANQCEEILSVELAASAALTISIESAMIDCDNTTGSLTATVEGGVEPYSYLWSNGDTTATTTELSPGSYDLTVTDANSCEKEVQDIQIVAGTSLDISFDILPITCSNDSIGVVTALVTGGVSPFNFTWSNGKTGDTIKNLEAGAYQVTVSDANGCEGTAEAIVEQTLGFSLEIEGLDIACADQRNGRATARIEGGMAPFLYNWNTGATGSSITSLAAGTYTLSVTDDMGCTGVDSVTILAPDTLQAIPIGKDITCFGAEDGAAGVEVSGGVAPYEYAWGDGSTTRFIEDLAAGLYGVIIRDANNCITTASITINEPPPLTLNLVVEAVPCEGNTDGMVAATVMGGVAPYQYRWSTGDTLATLEGVAGGTYQLTVSDASACEIVTDVMLEERPGVAISLFKQDIQCFGDQNGRIQAAVEGGTGLFQYAWTTGAATSSIENLTAGTYAVTVTDAALCSDTTSIAINEPDSISVLVDIEGLNCFGETEGKVTATVSGGTAPYLYQWSNDSTVAVLEDLLAGDYELSVVDAQACQEITKVSISSPDSLQLQFVIGQRPCADEESGQINVEVSGGTPEYSFSWSTGGTKSGIANVGTGWYYLTLTDANACTLMDSIFLAENPKLLCSINVVQDIDEGDDGSLEVIPIGGTSPYSFLWNTGDTTAIIDSLNYGDYSVTVTDMNACTTTCMDTLMGLATLGSFVWLDENRNGIQEEGESGFADVQITIQAVDFEYSSQTVTDESGFYELSVPPGRYQLIFALPSGFILTKPNQGEDDEKDSDVDPISLRTDTIQVRARDVILNLDAGYISECEPFTDAGLIATTTNYLCGAGNDPGPIINQVSPAGGNGAIEYMWMRSSERGPIEDGYWEMIPDSNVPTYDPGPLYETTYFVRCARREKCPTFVETNVVKIEVGTEAVAEVAAPPLICEGDEVSFAALGTGPTAVINWSFMGSAAPNMGTGEEVQIRYTSFGSFSGTLTVAENDCIASRDFPVNVTNNPVLCTSGLEVRAEVVAEEEQLVRVSWEMPVSDAELSYQLQYSSDGEAYETLVDAVEPVNWEDNQWVFSIENRAPKKGRNFFRIQVMDQMGRKLYSTAKEIVFLDQSALALLYPNPVTDQLYIEFFETYGEVVKLELYSFQGHLLQSATLGEEELDWQFSLENYGNGLYFVRVYFGDVPIKHLRFYKE